MIISISMTTFFCTLFSLQGPESWCVGLAYVALSRVRKITDLALDPMPSFDRLANIEKYSLFKARRKEDKRIEELEKKTIALIKQKRIDKEARANEEAHQVMQDLAELSNLSIVDESDVEMEEA